jgi:hypothetical protein
MDRRILFTLLSLSLVATSLAFPAPEETATDAAKKQITTNDLEQPDPTTERHPAGDYATRERGKITEAEATGVAIGGLLAPVLTIAVLALALVYTPVIVPSLFVVIAVERVLG